MLVRLPWSIGMYHVRLPCNIGMYHVRLPCNIGMYHVRLPYNIGMYHIRLPWSIGMYHVRLPCNIGMFHVRLPCNIGMYHIRLPCNIGVYHVRLPCNIGVYHIRLPCNIGVYHVRLPCNIGMYHVRLPYNIELHHVRLPCNIGMYHVRLPCNIKMYLSARQIYLLDDSVVMLGADIRAYCTTFVATYVGYDWVIAPANTNGEMCLNTRTIGMYLYQWISKRLKYLIKCINIDFTLHILICCSFWLKIYWTTTSLQSSNIGKTNICCMLSNCQCTRAIKLFFQYPLNIIICIFDIFKRRVTNWITVA